MPLETLGGDVAGEKQTDLEETKDPTDTEGDFFYPSWKMRIRIRVAKKNPPKSWETRIKIDRNYHIIP